jgi:hemerythrin
VNGLTFIQWNANFTVGVEAVDLEHRGLINAINALEEAVEGNYESSRALPLVARVAKESQSHFASEEAAMVEAGYPGATLHALKHQHMMDQILAFIARYGRDTSSLNQYTLNLLRDTLTLHIGNEDASFGRWMRERSGSTAA